MIDAAIIAAMTQAQLAEYKRAATYVVLVTVCDPEDRDRRFDQASELLKKAGILSITVPDILDVLKDQSNQSPPQAMSCELMENIESGFK